MRSIHVIRNCIKTKFAVRRGIAFAVLSGLILISSCASTSPASQVNENIKLSESSESGGSIQPGGDQGGNQNPQASEYSPSSENPQSSSNPQQSENPQPSELPQPDLKEQLAAFPDEYPSDQAAKDGFLVFNNSRNPDVSIGEEFIEEVLAGKPDSLLIYQSTTEGDPILSYVNYDGQLYQYCEDSSRDKFAGQSADKYREASYAYLIVYELDEGRYVFLMQDNDVTYEDLLSSSSPEGIDCQLLFVMPDEEKTVD